jgi:hypothetical protein
MRNNYGRPCSAVLLVTKWRFRHRANRANGGHICPRGKLMGCFIQAGCPGRKPLRQSQWFGEEPGMARRDPLRYRCGRRIRYGVDGQFTHQLLALARDAHRHHRDR